MAHHSFPRGLRRPACALLAIAPLIFVACGGTPTSPTSPGGTTTTGTPPPTGTAQTVVRIVDAITGSPVTGVSGTIGAHTAAASDGAGLTTVWAQQSGQYNVAFSAAAILSRRTSIKVPASETVVSTIPASFDVTAFDQMFRGAVNGVPQKLQRWTAAPPLIILTRPVIYEGSYYTNNPVVADAEISADDLQAMARDLTDGFVALTDHQLGTFSSVTFETPAPGSRVNVMRTGFVLVARMSGLTEGGAEHYWGYGRWATTSSGMVVGGNVMIDETFDAGRTASSQYRRCLRMHELGHALGYNHVTARASVMNSSARFEPNAWDLQAVHIAFQRVPGSTSPDTDPSSFSLNERTGAVTWGPPIF